MQLYEQTLHGKPGLMLHVASNMRDLVDSLPQYALSNHPSISWY